MINLLFSIIASTLIFIVFKLFNKYNINTFQAIVVNYFAACVCGLITYDSPIHIQDIVQSQWFYGAIFLGFLFISIFYIMALTSQKLGLSVVSVASKMSVVIPVAFGIYAYQEGAGVQKITGIILALIAVYLTSIKSNTTFSLKSLWLPIILFFGSGTIDTSIKYIETTYVADNGIPIFTATIFSIAAITGVLILTTKALKKQFAINFKTIFGGIVLGVVNYYSIFFLLKALNFENTESSTIFTINNVAIVMLSTLIGLFLFKEKLIFKNWIGIGLAIISITLVTLA
ncbi:EamA/RhaT family transporter [Lacinutrix iliipiscaria]|uniref:EamA/RhaT family transporter n=1 Tax=Lacinutrix iliipiscaria TaxID=1230532 RepID=A0ABW5WMD4_9FLAO